MIRSLLGTLKSQTLQVATYNAMIDACACSGRWEQALCVDSARSKSLPIGHDGLLVCVIGWEAKSSGSRRTPNADCCVVWCGSAGSAYDHVQREML